MPPVNKIYYVNMKNISQPLKVIALALVLSVGISYVSAWTAPTVTPPNGNVAAPLNVSGNDQTKLGSISAASFWDANDPVNFFVNPNGDSKVKNVFATGDVCLFGTSTCLSTVSGTPGPQGPAGAAGAVGPQGPAGSTGTGISGIIAPLKGKTISCSNGVVTAYAYVDATNGYPYARVTGAGGWDSGWVYGFSAGASANSANWNYSNYPSLTGSFNGADVCSTNWPMV